MIETSQDLGELAKALSAAQSEIMAASKDAVNPFFSNANKTASYATLASVWDACRGPLTKNGLSVSQLPVNSNGTVGVVTTLLHTSGQWMRSALLVQPEKNTPQAIGSAITYVRRYALAAVAGVAPEDDDGNEASGNAKKPPVAGGAAKANTVKATETEMLANASQVQQIHILKEKIGGWTGKADHPGHPYKLALSAYKNAKGEKCESSKDLTFEQASNLIKRMQGMIDRQAETAKAMEASTPIAGAMNGEREPGSDDDEPSNDNGEPADPGQIEDLRQAAKTRWGTKAKDLAPQWLSKEFGVDNVTALSKVEATRALQLLLSGETL